MSNPTDILGKIGKKVGEEIKSVKTDVAAKADATTLTNHINDTGNPHAVDASDVGLSNVENTKLSTWAGSANITTVGTLSSGSIPYSLLTNVPNLNSITGDLSISGNLTVNGTQTILKTQTVEVEDNEIELNLGAGGAETAQTSGIAINRGVGGGGSITASTGFSLSSNPYTVFEAGSPYVAWVTLTLTSEQAGVPAGTYVFGQTDSPNATNNTIPVQDKLLMPRYHKGITINSVYTAVDLHIENPSTGQATLENTVTGETALAFTYTAASNADKAKLQWDDTSSKWSFLVGTTKATVEAGVVAVPDKDGITINGVSLGDYGQFEAAFLAAL